MFPRSVHRLWLVVLIVLVAAFSTPAALAAEAAAPSSAEVSELLRREPLSLQTWPVWRGRLLQWIGQRGRTTHAAYDAARKFMRRQANAQGELSGSLVNDAFAWYLLGSEYLYGEDKGDDGKKKAARAEHAFRRSLQLDPNFARAHRNLAFAIWKRKPPIPTTGIRIANPELIDEGHRELKTAHELDPSLNVKEMEATAALIRERFDDAESLYAEALRQQPGEAELAERMAAIIVRNPKKKGPRAPAIKRLIDQFPQDGFLICMHALALAEDGEVSGANREFERVRRLGSDLTSVLPQPSEAELAEQIAAAIVRNPQKKGPRAPAIGHFIEQFPQDGFLVCMHALALAEDDDVRGAAREFEHARQLGTDPASILPPELVEKIEKAAAPGWVEYSLWTLAAFAGFYALWMLAMSLIGVLLAGRTRGNRALQLLQNADEIIAGGQVRRSRHESWLTRFYAVALFASLILFYVSLPFLIIGLLVGTGLLLYLIFMLPRIPIKLIVLIVVVGLGGAWAVLKSIFARPGKGSFGLPKTAEECPRIYQLLEDVAQRVDTEPVDEVYLAPGSAIGVHQEGRGPFGLFGVNRRVLTLGVSTLRFLTVGELQSILAHEYAHFSHQDTFYSRFIYQVTLSIQEAVNGMGQSGGWYNYINPFFWFLVLYNKAYNLLSAGFSRSREFLADRMAAGLYGSDVFTNALTKVCTDGTLFEMTIYNSISDLLAEDKSFVNMYEAFRNFRDEQFDAKERDELYQKLLDEKESLFASHPTFAERIAAVKVLPPASRSDDAPALSLCENAEEIEKELTDFLTGYMYHLRRLQAQAAAE